MFPYKNSLKLLLLLIIALDKLFNETESWSSENQQLQNLISNESVCGKQTVKADDEIFVWDTVYNAASTAFAISKPYCLNDTKGNMSLIVRKCNKRHNKWYPETVKCLSNQSSFNKFHHNSFCPEDLVEITTQQGYLCIRISEKPQPFQENFCYGSDTLLDPPLHISYKEANSIFQYLLERNIKRFWLPINRNRHNKYLNPFVIRLPGDNWGDVYEIPQQFHDILSVNHCISGIVEYTNNNHVNNNTIRNNNRNNKVKSSNHNVKINFRKEMTNCDRALYSACLYRNEFISYSGCSQGFAALSYKPHECYGIELEAGLFPDILQPLSFHDYMKKLNTFKLIFDALELSNQIYFRIDEFSDTEESFQKYTIEMNVDGDVRISQYNSKQNGLSKEILTNRKTVEMLLKHSARKNTLILTVYNRNYIFRFDDTDGIKCFTNADYDIITQVEFKMFWQNDLETKTLFELRLVGDGPGYYWCEAHTIFNFSIIRTTRVVANNQKQSGHTFATLLKLQYQINTMENQYLDLKSASKLSGKLLSKFSRQQVNELSLHSFNIMDLIEINLENDGINFKALCHITVSSKHSNIDKNINESIEASDELFSTQDMLYLRNLLTKLLQSWLPDHKVLESDVKSTEYCLAESIPKISSYNEWRQARYGQYSTTQQFCLQQNGALITRKCKGDFLWGAYWEDLSLGEVSCITALNDDKIITNNLQQIVLKEVTKRNPVKAISKMKLLLEKNIQKLIPADFYYMAEIIQDASSQIFKNLVNDDNKHDITTNILKICNYLMEVDNKIIRPSITLNSTNYLLDAFESLIDKMAINSWSFQNQNIYYTEVRTQSTNDSAEISYVNTDKKRKNMKNDYYIQPNSILQDKKRKTEIEEYKTHLEDINYEDIGVFVRLLSNFLVFVIDPNVANVTGIALFSSRGDTPTQSSRLGILYGSFQKYYYRFLLSNESVDDLLYEEDIHLATYIPNTLLNRLDAISNSFQKNNDLKRNLHTRIVIKIYSNSILFQEQITNNYEKQIIVANNIISISVPNHAKDLPEMLPIIFKTNIKYLKNISQSTNVCSYWNYETWSNDGIIYMGRSEIDENIVLCGCTHLTPFAYLITGRFDFSLDITDPYVKEIVKQHTRFIDIITTVGCSLSLIGIIGIFITSLLFQNWRQKASSKILLNLSVAIALQMIIFCFINTGEYVTHLIKNKYFTSCVALGALLQYSTLVQFSWMLIIAYLQFKRYVQVLAKPRPRRFILKSSLLGWGIPCFPVVLVLLLNKNSYIPLNNDNTIYPDAQYENPIICYPTGYSLYFGVIVPIMFVIVANLLTFFIIIYNFAKGTTKCSLRHTEKSLAISQIRLSVLLFFLLGLTWIFSLLALLEVSIIFSYLFSLTATLQGLVLFIYFVVLDPITRRMWGRFLCNICVVRENNEFSSSMKEITHTF